VFLICGVTASGQVGYRPITFGVKGGVPVTDAFHPGSPSFGFDTKRYTVGPTVEFNIPVGLAVEIDALYKRLSFDSNSVTLPSGFFARTIANSWEFPLLLKIRPGVTRHVKPYVAPGVNFRYLTGVDQVTHFFTGSTVTTSRPGLLQNRFGSATRAGAGRASAIPPACFAPTTTRPRCCWGSRSEKGFTAEDLGFLCVTSAHSAPLR
jgi:hypothetical protein